MKTIFLDRWYGPRYHIFKTTSHGACQKRVWPQHGSMFSLFSTVSLFYKICQKNGIIFDETSLGLSPVLYDRFF
jgi:hypothetical protein